jgi:hypothetical protein
MAESDDLPTPADIPWQLLSRRGPDSAVDPTSIATFVFLPNLPELEAKYPDDRLVYFKFSVSVFPFHLDLPRVPPLDILDEAFAPVWRLVFNVEIAAPDEEAAAPGMKPYFLSAAPVRRAMIETGVVGDYFTEGESDEVAIGRSGSHLVEGFHSTTKTRKFGVGASAGLGVGKLIFGGSASYSSSTTSISGGREVSQEVDTTNRQASEERRELLSHMTNVNNVLTLLTGTLVGTDTLNFSLWPPPLRPLSVDPDDENLWYAELLKRRSSGIEGMQDFYAVAIVPRGSGFCLSESVRRVSVLEPPLPDPPVQPSENFRTFTFNLADFTRVFSYVNGKYPQGTPLEELDVSLEDRLVPDPAAVPPIPSSHTRASLQAYFDAVGAVWLPNPLPPLPPQSPIAIIENAQLNAWVEAVKGVLATLPTAVKIDTVPRPVVFGWTFSNSLPPSMFHLHALTNPPSLPVPYKWVQDIWMEAAQYDYEAELAKSPLERGTILVDDRRVDICADVDAEGTLGEVTTTMPASPATGILAPVPSATVVRPWDAIAARDPSAKGRLMVSAWAAAEAQLGQKLSGTLVPAPAFTFRHPRMLELFLRRAARLDPADPRNLPLNDVARRLRLSSADVQPLKAAGVTNLSSLAALLLVSKDLERMSGVQPFGGDRRALASLASRALPVAAAQSLMQSMGEGLDAAAGRRERPPTPARREPRSAPRRRRRRER